MCRRILRCGRSRADGCRAALVERRVCQLVLGFGAVVDCARVCAAGAFVTGVLPGAPERQLGEQLDFNLLFRWFVGFGMDDAVWNHAVWSKNRDRLLASGVAEQFFAAVVQQAKGFTSDEHCSVDGTLIQAWSSHKSFRKKDGPDDDGTNFHGDKRSHQTHPSTADPEARLSKKSCGTESKLASLGHVLVENRNGLIAAAMVIQADGLAERDAALPMLEQKQKEHRGHRQGL